jgi:hypothetical protein
MDEEMVETITEEVVEDTTEEPKVEEASGPKQLRDALKREQERNKELRTLVMAGAYADLGLDPEVGLGKAIAKEYKGDASTEALAEYAQAEYGYTKPVGQEHPQGATIVQEQARLDAISVAAESIAPVSEGEALAKAEAEGDWEAAGRIKAAQLARMSHPR